MFIPGSFGITGQIKTIAPVERARSPAIQRVQSPLSRPSSRGSGPQSALQDSNWETDGMWDTPVDKPSPGSTLSSAAQSPISKEDKALEMARRKEERKQVRSFRQCFEFLKLTLDSALLCSRNKRKRRLSLHDSVAGIVPTYPWYLHS